MAQEKIESQKKAPRRKIMGSLIIVLILSILQTISLYAETYFISPLGKKAGDGTRENPFSLETALLKGGRNTYVFMPGDYYGPITLNSKHAGEEVKPTIFKSEIKWRAHLTGPNLKNIIEIIEETPFIIFDGFEIWGANFCGITSRSDNITIRNCWIHNNNTMGISIYKRKKITIENNLIEFNGMHPHFHHGIYLDGEEHIIQGNIIRHNSGYGMHLYPDISKSIIANNLIYGHCNHAGIIIVNGDKGEGIKFINNTVVNNAVGLEIWGTTGIIIENNILYKNKKAYLFKNIYTPHIDFNLYDEVLELQGPNDKIGNPHFVNSNLGIFWLGEKSDAIKRGDPRVSPEIDLWGIKRPIDNPPDLGAYQFIPLKNSKRILNRWQYGSRFNTSESGEIPDLWQIPNSLQKNESKNDD